MSSANAELIVDSSAVAANTRVFAERSSGTLMAVVKADAFGHGDQAATVLAHGAGALGVTSLGEAFALRDAGVTAPVLSWLNQIDADFEQAILRRVEVAVGSLEHLQAVIRASAVAKAPALVHLHVDIGMGRDGIPIELWNSLCTLAALATKQGLVRVVGVMGHFSSADEPDAAQHVRERLVFENAVRAARRIGLSPRFVHVAATAAVATNAGSALANMERVGAGLYGIDPSQTLTLQHALTLRSRVIGVRTVAAGTGVGYGHDFVTDRHGSLALIPLGYGDGLPRNIDGRAEVLVRGRRFPIVGRVSMDQIVIDTGAQLLEPGDAVTIFGPGTDGEPTAANWASWADTIEHDIVTRIGARVSRVSRSVLPVRVPESGDAAPGESAASPASTTTPVLATPAPTSSTTPTSPRRTLRQHSRSAA
ncbi:alanine racemase [Humidisolicoccus flavus]|uniref:alanine racemase n=1 Tax=Humidisolicoccus flavus TaxID=3111414 RepID=UPI0032433EB8